MEFSKKRRLLRSMASKFPAVLVTGPRSASMERLVREAFPGKSFIDLSNGTVMNLAKQSPITFLLAFPDGAVINDVSLLPPMVKAVRHYVEKSSGAMGRWIMLSTPDIYRDLSTVDLNQMNEYGLGVLDLSGLSVEELEAERIPTSNPFQVMLRGQCPDLLSGLQSKEDYIGNLMEKDVGRFINTSNREAFRLFMGVCAQYSAMPMSMNQMALRSGVSSPTAKSWIGIMEQTGLIRRTDDGENARSTRLFFRDTGILCHLLGIGTAQQLILGSHREAVTRTFAFNELARGRANRQRRHGISIGVKCDFTADWRQHYNMVVEPNIEVTDESIRRSREIGTGSAKPVILYLGDVTYTNAGIDCISFRDWEKLAEGIDYFS
ncbi:MAG: DUF4143 domain-containing protein [Spirochaetales bacterium]|nr:DUF4143 domain-containing protein [Spirochaetales bacterium]